MAARKQFERASTLADDADWAKVSEFYAFRLAERLAYWLESSDCPAPLVRWFADAVARAESDPQRFLAELGFTARKRRPRLGVAWTARMVADLMARGKSQSDAIEILVQATYRARNPVSKRTIENYLRKHTRDARQRDTIAALRAKPRRKKSRKQ